MQSLQIGAAEPNRTDGGDGDRTGTIVQVRPMEYKAE